MNLFESAKPLKIFTVGALLLCAGLAHAQYAWVDAKGQRHYSDRPPPPSTPPAKILKSPRPQVLLVTETQAPAPAAAGEQKPKAPPTLAERDADFKKRAGEQAQRERTEAEEAKRKAYNAQNCEAVRRVKAQLESGVRMSTVDKAGESATMTDEERARELARVNKILAQCS